MYLGLILWFGITGLVTVLLLVASIPSLLISYLTFLKVGLIWKLFLLPLGWLIGLVIGFISSIFMSQVIYNAQIYSGKTPSEIKAMNESSSGSMAEGIGSFIILVIVGIIMVPLCSNISTYLTAKLFF
ncbi:MAG: hypothetical protein ACM37W_03795 [Actinomycetota bacterium]